MLQTEEQRRWWFATHPEFSRGHRGSRENSGKERSESAIDPKEVDKYVDKGLQYEADTGVRALLKSIKKHFGTQAHTDKNDGFGDNRGNDWWSAMPREPEATIGPPRPPDFSDRARSVLDIFCPGVTKAYDRWRIGYYEAYPWAPGPLYDAAGDLLGILTVGLARIQGALAKTLNAAETGALQKAREELLNIWDHANFIRGWAVEDFLGRNLPRTFPGIDQFEKGVAASIKSMHLHTKTYQNPAGILYTGRKYVDQVAKFNGKRMGKFIITAEKITGRALRLAVPPGATKEQRSALKSLIEYGKQKKVKVEVIRLP